MGMVEDRIDMPVEHMKNVFGQFDTFMKKVEKAFHITVIVRGDELKLAGGKEEVARGKKVFLELLELSKRGREITEQNVDYAIGMTMEEKNSGLLEIDEDLICHGVNGKPIKPKTLGQKQYVDSIRSKMIVLD
jgi:phosphate starvation-inducible PhoH-like protein